ncbi:MAG: hypothetical protein IPI87_19045 [Betaproteobacteria bacterium]|nr:hypothetical protein [Betaproteobacteria bacterium]
MAGEYFLDIWTTTIAASSAHVSTLVRASLASREAPAAGRARWLGLVGLERPHGLPFNRALLYHGPTGLCRRAALFRLGR